MNYSTCIFDFDYTLGDATNGIVASVNFALGQMNFPLMGKDNIRKTVGMTLPDTFTHLTGVHDTGQRNQFVKLFKKKADEVMTDCTELFPDTIKVLSYLKSKGIKTGIVTTKYHYRIDEILSKFDIHYLIDIVVGGDDVKNAKPHPEALLTAIKKLSVGNDNVLYVGDSIIDAKTAHGANVDFIAVTTGTTGEDEFMQYHCIAVVNRLSQLLDNVFLTEVW
jgi:phosphoglycolate phosphatase